MRFFASLACLLVIYTSPARGQDTLQLYRQADLPYFNYKVQLGDDLSLLAKKYQVPMMKLAEFNGMSVQEGLRKGSLFKIPILPNNYRKKGGKTNTRPISYTIQEGDHLTNVARMFNVVQGHIQVLNNMADNNIHPGQRLLVGWVVVNKRVRAFASNSPEDTMEIPLVTTPNVSDSTVHVALDSLATPVLEQVLESHEFEQMFAQQTAGRSLNEASGAAVFYPLKMRVKKGIYYAFHNTAARGTILKINNPASGKTIYAKVLGPIPDLGEYQHAVVTISNNAIGELDARDKRMFCKLYYR